MNYYKGILKKFPSNKNLKKTFVGKWRITQMDDFDQNDVDMEAPARIEIENDGSGEFQFILVQGDMYGNFKNTPNESIYDFTWEGRDDCSEASGDGWLKLSPDGTAEGEIRFHHGDTHKFRAVKEKRKTKRM